MPPPRGSGNSGRWHKDCWHRDKLYGNLNSQAKWPGDLDLSPFDLESDVQVTCDVGYLCANFSLTSPLCSRLRPDVRDSRQTSDSIIA